MRSTGNVNLSKLTQILDFQKRRRLCASPIILSTMAAVASVAAAMAGCSFDWSRRYSYYCEGFWVMFTFLLFAFLCIIYLHLIIVSRVRIGENAKLAKAKMFFAWHPNNFSALFRLRMICIHSLDARTDSHIHTVEATAAAHWAVKKQNSEIAKAEIIYKNICMSVLGVCVCVECRSLGRKSELR